MVSAEDVIRIYKMLAANSLQIWLSGGWGIDALLGQQTRPHKDLDVIMLLDDVLRVFEIFEKEGYNLKEIWSENRWVINEDGEKIATAFVLHNPEGCEFDAHAIRLDEGGNGVPTWEAEDFYFTKQDLAGLGRVAGYPVRCITAKSQMICHEGYQLPEKHMRDLERLHEKFGVPYPESFS